MGFVKLCGLDDLWEGEMEEFEVDGTPILLVHNEGGNVVAFDGRCPHQQAALIDGEFKDGLIICPVHLWQFDPVTGKGVNPGDCQLERFQVRVTTDEDIEVDIGIIAAPGKEGVAE